MSKTRTPRASAPEAHAQAKYDNWRNNIGAAVHAAKVRREAQLAEAKEYADRLRVLMDRVVKGDVRVVDRSGKQVEF